MNESDKKEFAQTMQLASIAYDRECDQPMLRAYFEFLDDYSIEQIKSAVKAHCKGTGIESKFFPKVADITAQIHGSKKEAEQSNQFTAEAAWLSIPKAISGVGVYGSPKFKDPITTACVSILTWKTICNTQVDKMVWIQKEFVELYQSLSTKRLEELPNNIQGLEAVQDMKTEFKTLLTSMDNLKVDKQ